MSMFGDIAREDMTKYFCTLLAEAIENNKQDARTVEVLKELGIKVLTELPNIPKWAGEYCKLFSSRPDKNGRGLENERSDDSKSNAGE